MIDFIGKRYYFFGLSILIILAGIIGYFTFGLNLDIQFQGGTVIKIQMADETFDANKAENLLSKELNKRVLVQKTKTYLEQSKGETVNQMIVSIGGGQALSRSEQLKVVDLVKSNFKVKDVANNYEVESITAAIGTELRNNAIKAIIVASILIVLYIWWRFKIMSGLSAGVFAVLALLHDSLIMLTVYILFKIPINESFIAAVLTILGYSMNDTIIIYDRIRENSHLLRKTPIAQLTNTSIVQTLNRSINTVLSVLICIVTAYVYASISNIESIKEFSLPLIVGLTSGAYSSIFIASPLWVMWKQHTAKNKAASKAKPSKA